MTVWKDTRKLGERVFTMIQQISKGEKVEVNDEKTYNNGVKVVPSYLLVPVSVDKSNYEEIVVKSGYIKAEELQ